jgi:hypothetical protein
MKRYLAAVVAAIVIGPLASIAVAQNYPKGDPGEAPLASPTGGKPAPVDPAEVKRDNTASPGSAPLASTTGGKPQAVDPAELKRDNTANPGSLPSAKR